MNCEVALSDAAKDVAHEAAIADAYPGLTNARDHDSQVRWAELLALLVRRRSPGQLARIRWEGV